MLKNPAFLFYCFSICLFTAAFKSAFTFLPALAKSQVVTDRCRLPALHLRYLGYFWSNHGWLHPGYPLHPPVPSSPLHQCHLCHHGRVVRVAVLRNLRRVCCVVRAVRMLTGTYVSQKSVILVDILGQEKLSSSFGLMICFQGIGTCIGPPLSGISHGFDLHNVLQYKKSRSQSHSLPSFCMSLFASASLSNFVLSVCLSLSVSVCLSLSLRVSDRTHTGNQL